LTGSGKTTLDDVLAALLGGVGRRLRLWRWLFGFAAAVVLAVLLAVPPGNWLDFWAGTYDLATLLGHLEHTVAGPGPSWIILMVWLGATGGAYVRIGRSRNPDGPPVLGVAFVVVIAGFAIGNTVFPVLILYVLLTFFPVTAPAVFHILVLYLYGLALILIWLVLWRYLRRSPLPWPARILRVSGATALFGGFGVLSTSGLLPTFAAAEFSPALLTSLLATIWGLGTALYIFPVAAGDRDMGSTAEASVPDQVDTSPDASSYISSARQLSITLFGLLVLSFDFAFSHLGRVQDLQTTRQVFAQEHAATRLEALADTADDDVFAPVLRGWRDAFKRSRAATFVEEELVVDLTDVDGIGQISLTLVDSVSFVEVGRSGFGVFPGATVFIPEMLRVEVHGRSRWSVHADLPVPDILEVIAEDPSEVGGAPAIRELFRQYARELEPSLESLADVAFRRKLQEAGDVLEPADFYRVIEREFLGREFKVPTVDVGVSPLTVMWWIALILVALLIVIRNRVRAVLRDPTFGRSEPWLVIDRTVGLEGGLANLWLWSVLLSPWLVGTLLLMTVSGETVASGLSQTHLFGFGRMLALIAIPIAGGWVAASLVAALLTLRRLRAATVEPSPEKHGTP